MGCEPMWVVKDPLSRAFSYFSDQEHEILRLADGKRSLLQIASECQRRFAPEYISSESLVRFFAEARQKGLLLVNGCGKVPETSDAGNATSKRPWWRNPLAIRLPGWNPDRFLDWIVPLVRPLFSPWILAFAVVAMVAAILVVVQDLQTLERQLSVASVRFQSGGGIWMFVAVLSVTKVVHELAHAVVCKRFGGECREIGVMFLVGIPCLYCDVSDAWMLPRRWQRILVSAAGMVAELTLAAAAALIWSVTVGGPIQDLCVIVMVVCSITTVVFNGNPLLRYDGYYILSDCVGVPNLAAESSGVLNAWLRKIVWGVPLSPTQSVSKSNWLLTLYSVASMCYRAAIYALILLMIFRFAERHEMGDPVGLAALAAMGLFICRGVKSVMMPPHCAIRHHSLSFRRPWLITALVVAFSLGICLIPLPRTSVAWMTIQPANARVVYVTKAGRLDHAVPSGADVRTGELLVSLANGDVDLALRRSRGERDVLETELDVLQRRRNVSRDASERIPEVERSLRETTDQVALQERVAGQLHVHAPQEGRVFAAADRPRQSADDRQPVLWDGSALESRNRGAWMEEGTALCIIGDAEARQAVIFVRQQDVELVDVGQRVNLMLADYSSGDVRGRVSEVAATPSESIPQELQRPGMLEQSKNGRWQETYYQVRVMLEPTITPLPVRLTGQAKVHVRSASLFQRLARFLRDAFV